MEVMQEIQVKASELRMGSVVNLRVTNPDGKTVSAYGVIHTLAPDFARIGDGIKADYRHLFPIPLTPELLQKCGFSESLSDDVFDRTIYGIQVANNTSLYFDPHKDWMRNDYEVEWYLSHEWNNNHFKNDFWAKPKYLHQLQNLYFALTGEELEISL